MLHVSHENPEQTRNRLLKVLAAADVYVYENAFVFEEFSLADQTPAFDERTLAIVRDDHVWSRLVPASEDSRDQQFGIFRIHFPEGVDNSGFVGWLASHLKDKLGTGVFVICGQNSQKGGIFDYTGFPADLTEAIRRELQALQDSGEALKGR